MSASREYLLWAAALLVERDYGSMGSDFINRLIDDLITEDDVKGVEMWLKVAEKFDSLNRFEMAGQEN